MKMPTVIVLVALLGAGATTAFAQDVALEFKDGKVSLKAQTVPVSQILTEWARRGRTTIVNGERVPGPAVTIELQDTPEQQALEILLRGVSGYLIAARETAIAGASWIDRVYILPTSSRPTTATVLPQPQQALQLQDSDDDDVPRVNPGAVRLPPGVANRPAVVEAEDDRPEPEGRPAAPTNPFGVAPGTARPGVISPSQPTPNRPRE